MYVFVNAMHACILSQYKINHIDSQGDVSSKEF